MKAIDFNKVGLIAIAALTLSACENGLTNPDAQDVEGIDALTYDSRSFLPTTPPPVLIFENGNETLCVPAGRSHQVQWRVYDRLGQVRVSLRSRAPGGTASASEYTTIRNNSNIRSGEGEGSFSAVIGQDENGGAVRMDPLREYQYSVVPANQYYFTKPLNISRSDWFQVAETAQGTTLICN